MKNRIGILSCILLVVVCFYFYQQWKIEQEMPVQTYINAGVKASKENKPFKAKRYYLKGLKLAENQTISLSNYGLLYFNIGLEYNKLGQKPKAQEMFDKAIEKFELAIKNQTMLIKDPHYTNALYMKALIMDNCKEKEQLLLKAYNLSEQSNDTDLLLRSSSQLTVYYAEIGNVVKVQIYAQKNLEVAKKTNKKHLIVNAMERISTGYILAKNYDKAQKTLEEAINIAKQDQQSQYYIPVIYKDLSFIALKQKKCVDAEAYYAKYQATTSNQHLTLKHYKYIKTCDYKVDYEDYINGI